MRNTKIGVVSDTHGNLPGLRAAVREMTAREKIDLFIHLGDNYEDAEVLDEFGYEYLRVPGVFHDLYAGGQVSNRLIEEFDGWKFMLSHTHEPHPHDLPVDPDPARLVASGKIDVLLFGHLHRPSIETQNGVLLLNPGHLKDKEKRGVRPSYAVLELERDRIDAKIYESGTGVVLKEVSFKRVRK